MEGPDYRGMTVFAATHPIAGTPWHLVAKIDRDEVMAPLHELIYWLSLLTFAAVTIIAMVTWRLWRQVQHNRQLELSAQAKALQQESEKVLHVAEDLTRSIMDSLQNSIAVLDQDGTIIRINQHWRDFAAANGGSDLTREGVGLNYYDICKKTGAENEKWAESALAGMQQVSHGDLPFFSIEYPCHSPTESRWFLLQATPLIGSLRGVVVNHINITERRQNEEELKTFFALIPELVCIASTEGHFLKINPMWQAVLGYTEAEILATPFIDFVHPDDRDATTKEVERQLAGKSTMHFINRYRCKDGSYRWLDWGATPAINENLLFAAARDITERLQMEQKLVESEQHFRTLSDSGSALIWTSGLDRLCDYFNEPWLRFTGRTLAQELGNGWAEGVHPDDFERCLETYVTAFDQRKPFCIEYRLRHAEGSYHWIRDDGNPRYDSHGEFLGYIGFCIDISQHKAADEKIRLDGEQQSILRQLLEYTLLGNPLEETLKGCLEKLLTLSWLSHLPRGGIFLSDQEGKALRLVISINLSAEIQSKCAEVPYGHCLCGLAAANGQMEFSDCVDERHAIGYHGMHDHGHYSLPLTTNGRVVGVLLLNLPPGSERDEEKERFLSSVSNILAGYISRKAGEQILAEQQAHLEDTVRERTAELVTSEARTRAIVTTMLDCVVHIDSRGIILSVNFATLDMFGYEEEEMLGRNVSMLMPEPLASTHDSYLARYMQTRQPHVIDHRLEVTGRRKDGSLFPLELAVNEMVDDAGSTFIGVLRDISQQKVTELEIKQALQAAQSAAEAKSNFLANMSHEIRTPLNGVLGLAQIGLRDAVGRETAETFKRIRDSGNHLLAVVNDILDFSKIEAGKLKIEKRPFALFSIIDNVKSFVSSRAEEKGLSLSISIAPDLSDWVEGDSLRLAQILTNLLSNSIKFTEQGEVMLRVSREGNYLDFMVVDSGIGMNKEQMARLFQAFEQADGSTTRNYGGTGLGLAISRDLAHLMGGEISVDSNLGEGSTFYLHLPLPAVAAPVHTSQPGLSASATGPRLTGLSVLAADDVDINRFILEDLLSHEGARIVFAEDGQQALEMLKERGVSSFDMVLMDVQMPVMDGFEATRRIAGIAPALPVIGLTAHAMAEERDKCLAAGMVDHVSKPVDIDILVTAILRHLHPATQPAPIEPAAATVAASDSPAGCDDPDVIDLAILASRVGSEPEKIVKYTTRFIEAANTTLTEMKTALVAGDLNTVCSLGHRLKSAALTVGAMRFGALCQELESLRAGNDLEAAKARVEQLHELFGQINQRVRDVVQAKSAE